MANFKLGPRDPQGQAEVPGIPSKRTRKPKDPCPVCFLHLDRCLCAHLPRLNLKTRIALVIHTKELKRTTNTGRLALHALPNSAMYVRG